ncbi:MAG: hypothetical protein U0939_11390 [Pirellulales bacterium]
MNGWMKKWLAGAAAAAVVLAATTAAQAGPPHAYGGHRPAPHGVHYNSSGYRGPHSNYGAGYHHDRRYDDRRYDRDWDRDCDRRPNYPVSSGYRGPAPRPLPPTPYYNPYAPSNSSAFGLFGRNFGVFYRN